MASLNACTRPMGVLDRLPPELRLMVWEEFLNSVYPSRGSRDAPREGLGLLRTCRQIYEETSHLIYERGSFSFEIFSLIPSLDCDGGSDSGLRQWRFQFPDDDPEFRYISWERTGEINVEIQAPRQDDPGQIITLWKKTKLLVDLLSTAKSLTSLEIHFNDSFKGQWFTDGTPQQSIKANPSIETGNAELPTDFRALLLLFTNLRNVKNVCFHVPDDKSMPKSLVNKCTKAMVTEGLLWSGLLNSHLSSDRKFQDELDTTFMQFDRALDTLHGGTADWLRLERFSSWYVKDSNSDELQESEYVRELQRISTAGRIAASRHGNTSWAIRERYILMHCFNPLGSVVQRMKGELHLSQDQKADLAKRRQLGYPQGNRNWDIRKRWSERGFLTFYFAFRRLKRKGELCVDYYTTDFKRDFVRKDWFEYYVDGILPLQGFNITEKLKELMRLVGEMEQFEGFGERFERVDENYL